MNEAGFPKRPPVSKIYLACFRAIQRGKKLVFVYEGKKQKGAFPHILGHRDGKEWLFVFQTDGDSDGPLPDWRCIEVAKMSQVQLTDARWRTGPSHKSRQNCVGVVDIDINPAARQRYRWPETQPPDKPKPASQTAKKKKPRAR